MFPLTPNPCPAYVVTIGPRGHSYQLSTNNNKKVERGFALAKSGMRAQLQSISRFFSLSVKCLAFSTVDCVLALMLISVKIWVQFEAACSLVHYFRGTRDQTRGFI